jgi:hypothetical protein
MLERAMISTVMATSSAIGLTSRARGAAGGAPLGGGIAAGLGATIGAGRCEAGVGDTPAGADGRAAEGAGS